MGEAGDLDDGSLDATAHPEGREREAVPAALALTEASAGGGVRGDGLEPVLQRGAMIGRYVVLDRIGSGTMGLVLAAFDPMLDRKVAIKLVRPDLTGSTLGRQRLIREAQAMAKLSHPNVVTVFEAGTFGDHVFLAMEYVAGTTLAEWFAVPGRTMREIVAAFVGAGRGLAAAHKVGLVHRDFKPTNVLVSADGDVRVADFGLATGTVGDDGAVPERRGLVALAMTATGALLGTPAYMAPEQHRGQPADARADQFAFCVALHEALYRTLPFEGEDYATYSTGVLAGTIREPARGTDVPARIRRVIVRGLATDPARRYPSMTALLADLEHDPRARRWLVAGSLAGVAAIAIAVVASAGGDDDPCRAAVPSLAGKWDAAIRRRVETGFAAADPRAGGAIATRVAAALDRRATELGTMRHDACAATHVRRQQSAELLDRRTRCLDARTAELAALATVFADAPDAGTVERAINAALSLPPIADCADVDRLLAVIPPPIDPAARLQVGQLETEIATADALYAAGKYKAAAELLTATAARADALGYAPVSASAHALLSAVDAVLEDFEPALAESRRAGALAAEAHDDALLAEVWIQLYGVLGSDLARADEVRSLEPLIAAAIVRAGGSPVLRAQLDTNRGAIEMGAGEYATAAESFAAARRGFETALGPEHPRVAQAMVNAAIALGSDGRYDQARDLFTSALALLKKIYGDEHPNVAHAMGELAGLLDSMGHSDQALVQYQAVAAIEERVLPPDHPRLASTYGNIAVTLDALGRLDEALVEHQRALAILERRPSDNRLRMTAAVANMAITLQKLGRHAESLAAYERALAMREAVLGPDHPDVADTLNSMALALYEEDRPRARALWERVLAIRRAKLGEDNPRTAMSYAVLAQEAYDRGADREASDLLDHALAVVDRSDSRGEVRGYAEIVELRGQVRARLGRHADAARDLEVARDGYAAAGNPAAAAGAGAALATELWTVGGATSRAAAIAAAKAALALYEADDKLAKDAAGLRRWLAAHRPSR